ncbi:Uncharacterised protein [Klebsiella pneumoniae]|nr:Uncharacterised protein [Klebsiella pneumoniae]
MGPRKPWAIDTCPAARLARKEGIVNGERRRGPRSSVVCTALAISLNPPIPVAITVAVRSCSASDAGDQPAWASASRAATSANSIKRSIFLRSFAGMVASGSKPCSGSLSMDGTWPATLQGISATSCSLSRVIPDLPASSDCQTCCTPQPSGLTIPIPVTTMRLTETPIVNSPVVSVCRRLFHQGNQQRGN